MKIEINIDTNDGIKAENYRQVLQKLAEVSGYDNIITLLKIKEKLTPSGLNKAVKVIKAFA